MKRIIDLIYNLITRPSIRCSLYSYVRLGSIFKYFPYEEILKNAMDFVSSQKIEGDYLEFGVAGGRSFSTAYHFAKRYGLKSMKFYAFDSFQGLPEITGVDAEYPIYKKGEFANNIEKFKKNISSKGVDLKKTKIISGWFSNTLNEKTKNELNIKSASIVFVDCDLYKSTVPVLDFITDYIVDGTVIVFDDWFAFKGNPNRGERRAFKEWLEKNPDITTTEFYRYGAGSNSFILHKK